MAVCFLRRVTRGFDTGTTLAAQHIPSYCHSDTQGPPWHRASLFKGQAGSEGPVAALLCTGV